MRTAGAAMLTLVLTLGACSDGNDAGTATPPADRPTTTITTAVTATSGTSLAPGSLTLGPRSLAGVPFGTEETEAETALAEALGPPDSDNVLPPGSCSTGATRSLSWDDLNVFFGPGDGDDGGDTVLAGWTYGSDELPASPPAATPEGVGAGATLAQLRSAYGDRLEVDQDSAGGAVRFSIIDAGGAPGITGILTGPADTDTVRGLFAGGYCG